MMASIADSTKLQHLLRDLERQKEACDEAIRKVQEAIASPPPDLPPSLRRASALSPLDGLSHLRHASTGLSTLDSSSGSRSTGDESEDEEDQSLYAQDFLLLEHYEDGALREHLKNHAWTDDGRRILQDFAGGKKRLEAEHLILPQKGDLPDGSHHTHFQIFDVGNDGAPLPIEVKNENVTNLPTAFWQTIKTINPLSRQRKAVGRITIVREPVPVLFGALHYTMHKHFDMDELFRNLVEPQATFCSFDRAFHQDPRRQSSFIFSFEYFTLIGKGCHPMRWQLADSQASRNPDHIAITRCSSVVALSLGGKPIKKIRNTDRRAGTTHGFVYDPWSSYHVLNIQCFPDLESSLNVHDSAQHYVNGVEAFLITLLGEYKDAEKRFDAIYKQISNLVIPSLAFMFQADFRDKLLFEDDKYTYSRRYFWAYQTLGIMIDSMTAMVDAYEDNFTDQVWEGQHRTLWPLLEPDSTRNKYYKKKMTIVRAQLTQQVASISKLILEYQKRRTEIHGLRDQLFSGTSVMEARKSVLQAEITVQQGHNIKLLTLVNLFFLPLTFVTSVFGMEILPENEPLWRYAAVTVAICLPCFILIGSLNSRAGMIWWRQKFSTIGKQICKWLRLKTTNNDDHNKSPALSRAPTIVAPTNANDYPLPSDNSTHAKMARRLRRLSSSKNGDREKAARLQEMVREEPGSSTETQVQWGETRQGMSRRMSEMIDSRMLPQPAPPIRGM